jgi:hypothetical protein
VTLPRYTFHTCLWNSWKEELGCFIVLCHSRGAGVSAAVDMSLFVRGL